MNDEYLDKIFARYDIFKNEKISDCDQILTLDLSEINIFRLKNKFALKDVIAIKTMKNVKSKPDTLDFLYVFLVNFKNEKQYLFAVADPVALHEDPSIIGYQEL